MSESELTQYNGDDPTKPIYLALDGFVYDVSKGAEFYADGNVYHFLAGKDASAELHIAGGTIIQKKYPIIARLTK